MKKIGSLLAAFLLLLTGCTVEFHGENAAVPTETTVLAENAQTPTAQPKQEAENRSETEDHGASAAQGESDAAGPSETLTEPPALTVSTLNHADSVVASCGNSTWNHTMPDGTTATLVACGAHPLDQQGHPILYTAFPPGSLPPLEEGANLGMILSVFDLDFGEILPETVSAVRWPASYIGSAQTQPDFEEVAVEIAADTITLTPLGDGDYVYQVAAHWGEMGDASYTFRTLPQIRGEQDAESAEVFQALNALDYQPYTCDGLPEYRLTAADGTVYAINLTDKWVWRGNSEQAELSDELIAQLEGNASLVSLVISDKPLETP